MIVPLAAFKRAARILPVLCVDVIVENPDREYLLVKRTREPMKGRWWVIGGRVFKGESLAAAAARKVKEETGLAVKVVGPVGYYEHLAEKTPWGGRFRRHSASVVFLAKTAGTKRIRLDAQSAAWKFAKALPAAFRIVPIHQSGPAAFLKRR